MKFPFSPSKVVVSGLDTLPFESYFQDLRSKEYARLDANNQVYLDFTGGNLYAQSQIDAHHQLLKKNVFGNPHSTNPTSLAATLLVKETRSSVLRFFNAEEDYFCVFTPNASGALRIVGESYPFHTNSAFLLLSDNHNSVNGIREYCRNKGGSFAYGAVNKIDYTIDEKLLLEQLKQEETKDNKLFAFPAQSNVTGIKHDLSWVKEAQKRGWEVLLDAAAFVPTSALDLSEIQPDFVSMSFYKMFGYPTGIGCLLIKKKSFDILQKPWFAGGTVDMVGVADQKHWLVNDHERFEDGTINYLDIPAIKIGLDYLSDIGMHRINDRVKALSEILYRELNSLQHDNGQPLLRIHGPKDRSLMGGTLMMNFLDQKGNLFPTETVEHRANSMGISLRSGCFCNPGIDEISCDITAPELQTYFSNHEDGKFGNKHVFMGRVRGATRISVGLSTNKNDLDTFVTFAQTFLNQVIEN